MIKNLESIQALAGGSLNLPSKGQVLVKGVSKDTRTLEEGNLYIPIIGENFDGHDFLQEAIIKGAAASLWQEDHPLPDLDFPLIIVEDVLRAFQTLAKNYRQSLDIPLIAITGSNGKTTTKDILKSVLATKYKTHATKGNENNEIGLPLTILGASEDTQIIIAELGTESFGEIAVLSEIAQPNVSIITNIGDSHLDKLKTKENVALEKMDIIKSMKESGVLIYNKDDKYLRNLVQRQKPRFKTLSFGSRSDSKYIISEIDIRPGATRFKVNDGVYQVASPGLHEAYNATISVIVSQLFDISPSDLSKGLSEVKFTSMRNQLLDMGDFSLIDDSYKANPQNVMAALDTMTHYKGYARKIAVLGDMLDLGEGIAQLHRQVVGGIDPQAIDYVLLFGDHMKDGYDEGLKNFSKDRIFHFSSKDELVKTLETLLIKNSLVLVKGSRSMKMEEIIQGLG